MTDTPSKSWADLSEELDDDEEIVVDDFEMVKRFQKQVKVEKTNNKQNKHRPIKSPKKKLIETKEKCFDCGAYVENDLLLQEKSYGKFRIFCKECKSTNQDEAKIFEAKCCLCKNKESLFFVSRGSVFQIQCVVCCEKMKEKSIYKNF